MLILLDIDGVMVPAASWRAVEMLNDGFPAFSNSAVAALQKLISDTGASIVLTTTHKGNYTIPEWTDIFKKRGITARINKLSNNVHNLSRKEEILNWLHIADYSEFVIIDDDTSLNDLSTLYKERLVLTSPMVGLKSDGAERALQILNTRLIPV